MLQSDGKLVIALSSRALFDLNESHRIFESEGIDAYTRYQIDHEEDVLAPGVAFPLVQKLLALKNPENADDCVEVILISRNSGDTGLRIFNSIQHHQLRITRAAFTGGSDNPYRYAKAFGAHLFLSTHSGDVDQALKAGCAAATIMDCPVKSDGFPHAQLRIAFDGDAVIFSDEAEQIFQQEGLRAFRDKEALSAKQPLQQGPFKEFLYTLHLIQKQFPAQSECPIRTALITARDAPAHERVIRTLRAWDIRIDESLFLGGRDKGAFLKAFAADIYFDDQQGHCESTRQHVATGHVPHGVIGGSPA